MKKPKKGRKPVIDNTEILKQMLLTGSPTATAKALGVHYNTINKRLKQPGFMEQLELLRGEMLQLAVDKMKSKLSKAVDVISAIMEDDEAPATLRLQAANTFLSQTVKYIQISDFENRIRELEKETELI